MLVAEVSKLSEVWDTLNKQNRDKILELAQYERRIEQISMEKQKAIQKYFACEREKEAIANEREAHMRVAASAKAAIELMREEERSLNAKITAAELEITKRQTFLDEAYKEQKKVANSLTTAESDVARYKRERDQEASSHLERKKELQDETAARKKADEDCAKLAFELEQTKKRLEATSSGTASKSRYANLDARELQQECDNLYVRMICILVVSRKLIVKSCVRTSDPPSLFFLQITLQESYPTPLLTPIVQGMHRCTARYQATEMPNMPNALRRCRCSASLHVCMKSCFWFVGSKEKALSWQGNVHSMSL